MNYSHRAATALAALVCTALVGCSSTMNTAGNERFACEENRDCPTPLEVYKQTNTTPIEVKNGRTPESWKSGARNKQDEKERSNAVKHDLNLDLTTVAPSAAIAVAGDPPPRPLREPSQVMRIWIAPWIDQNDNLNWSGYVYTEVTAKRWSIGEQEVRHQGVAPQFLPR